MNNSYRNINRDVKEILNRTPEPAFDGTVKEGWVRKYTVINERDVNRYVGTEDIDEFRRLLDYYLGQIEHGRGAEGKNPSNNYIVINLDEDYAPEVIDILKRNGHWG